MRIDVLTLFPGMFSGFLAEGLIRIAREKELVDVHLHDFREFATDRHRSVDDRPFGGGPGMVLMCGPIYACDEAVVAAGRAAERARIRGARGREVGFVAMAHRTARRGGARDRWPRRRPGIA